MVKTISSSGNGATKKKSLFGKIFKKNKSKKAQQPEEEERNVAIVVERVEEVIEETRDGAEGDAIPKDPSAMEPLEEAANPDKAYVVVEPRDGAVTPRDGADILADLERDDAPMVQQLTAPSQGWMGGWLENMTNMCGPADQGLPTIMSGEEMDMDMIANGESTSVMSPTSTVNSTTDAPLSPTTPKESQKEETTTPKESQKEETTMSDEGENEKEQDDVKIVYTEIVYTEPPQEQEQEQQQLTPAPIDAPTSPKSLMVSPRVTKLEPEEDVMPTPSKKVKTPKAKEEDDNTTLVVSPEKDDMVQGVTEPVGTKMDIFSSLTACCNPIATPSMDETEGVKQIEASPETPKEKSTKDPDGDKGEDAKSVAQDSQSVVAEEKKEEETTKSLPTTPVSKSPAKKEVEEEEEEEPLIVGSIHKEKKNTKMGLSLKNSTMYQGVFIAKIKPGSLFSKTKLREGMQVSEIQGKPCPVALEEAVNMLRHAVGELEIVAQKPKCEI
ncbi:MAG: hypothetical protein SGBAC_006732 [Bacillariaceae sp.]